MRAASVVAALCMALAVVMALAVCATESTSYAVEDEEFVMNPADGESSSFSVQPGGDADVFSSDNFNSWDWDEEYWYQVDVRNELGYLITGATVTTGDGFGVTCREPGSPNGTYYCALLFNHGSTDVKVVRSRYATKTFTGLLNFTTSKVTINASDVRYNLKLTVKDCSGAVIGATMTILNGDTSIGVAENDPGTGDYFYNLDATLDDSNALNVKYEKSGETFTFSSVIDNEVEDNTQHTEPIDFTAFGCGGGRAPAPAPTPEPTPAPTEPTPEEPEPVYQPPPCGNGVCTEDESMDSCCKDCGCPTDQSCDTVANICISSTECGNGECESGEDAKSCIKDCGFCGDGVCHGDETQDSCCADCGCPSGSDCEKELMTCIETVVCGDGVCEYPENPESCNADCAACGNGKCDPGESTSTCCMDCLCGEGLACDELTRSCAEVEVIQEESTDIDLQEKTREDIEEEILDILVEAIKSEAKSEEAKQQVDKVVDEFIKKNKEDLVDRISAMNQEGELGISVKQEEVKTEGKAGTYSRSSISIGYRHKGKTRKNVRFYVRFSKDTLESLSLASLHPAPTFVIKDDPIVGWYIPELSPDEEFAVSVDSTHLGDITDIGNKINTLVVDGQAICGNFKCESGETIDNCPVDCSCGNGVCENRVAYCKPFIGKGAAVVCYIRETIDSCLQDCSVCGDGLCDRFETQESCCTDCSCAEGLECRENLCEAVVTPAECGDGACEPPETFETCCSDCACPSPDVSCIDNSCVPSPELVESLEKDLERLAKEQEELLSSVTEKAGQAYNVETAKVEMNRLGEKMEAAKAAMMKGELSEAERLLDQARELAGTVRERVAAAVIPSPTPVPPAATPTPTPVPTLAPTATPLVTEVATPTLVPAVAGPSIRRLLFPLLVLMLVAVAFGALMRRPPPEKKEKKEKEKKKAPAKKVEGAAGEKEEKKKAPAKKVEGAAGEKEEKEKAPAKKVEGAAVEVEEKKKAPAEKVEGAAGEVEEKKKAPAEKVERAPEALVNILELKAEAIEALHARRPNKAGFEENVAGCVGFFETYKSLERRWLIDLLRNGGFKEAEIEEAERRSSGAESEKKKTGEAEEPEVER